MFNHNSNSDSNSDSRDEIYLKPDLTPAPLSSHKGFGPDNGHRAHKPTSRHSIRRIVPGPVDRKLAPNVSEVEKPEVYLHPGYTEAQEELAEERMTALGWTPEYVDGLASGDRTHFGSILGTERFLKRSDLLFLDRNDLDAVHFYCRNYRDKLFVERESMKKMFADAANDFDRDRFTTTINWSTDQMRRLEAFERVAEAIKKCSKASAAVFIKTDEHQQRAFHGLKDQIKDLAHDNAEYRLQIQELTAALEKYKSVFSPKGLELVEGVDIDPHLSPSVNIDDWLDSVDTLCAESPGLQVHSEGACGSMVIHYVKSRQAEDSLFWGTTGDHEDPEQNGHFMQKDVVQYIKDQFDSDSSDWTPALNDLDLIPSGTKTYLSDRVSAAMCKLVEKTKTLGRNCHGGKTLWATRNLLEQD